jgi:hypothetical protein
VVFLSGSVPNESQAARAIALAQRLRGVATVDDGITRSHDIQGNVLPLIDQFKAEFINASNVISRFGDELVDSIQNPYLEGSLNFVAIRARTEYGA